MYKIITGIFSFLIISYQLDAQFLPKEGSKLNYRIIGFSFPESHPDSKYTIEIAAGTYYNEDSFKENIITSFSNDTNRIIGEVPDFGKPYTWCIVTTIKSKSDKSILYHFSTGIIPEVDSSVLRLKVIKSAEKYKDAYVFLDNTGVLYDMKGKPVWFLPDIDSTGGQKLTRDTKITPQGTITFLMGLSKWDINYNGDVLWKMSNVNPKGIKGNSHEFTRLSNGHYMLFKNELVLCKLPFYDSTKGGGKTEHTIVMDGNDTYQKMLFGTVVEYDEKGNKVWSWNPSDYFKRSDLYNCRKENGMFDFTSNENSFYFDEKNKFIYISCKAISRILKVKYPEGTVLNGYGNTYKPGITELGNSMFCGQHSCKSSDSGYIYLYNNNSCVKNTLPKIIIMKDSVAGNNLPEKIWEYECTIDDTSLYPVPQPYTFVSGGNVIELSDGSMFVSMGTPYNKVFIVNRHKEILWSAIAGKYDPGEKKWQPFDLYRASIITDQKELEKLIWNGSSFGE